MFIPFKDPPSTWSNQVVIRTRTKISFMPSKVNFDIKGTQFTYNMACAHYWQNKPFIKPPDSKRLTRCNIEFTDMLVLICYWWLYLNLVSPILLAVGAIYKCVSLNSIIVPVAFVPFCVHVFAWWHAKLMFIHDPTCEITFMITFFLQIQNKTDIILLTQITECNSMVIFILFFLTLKKVEGGREVPSSQFNN